MAYIHSYLKGGIFSLVSLVLVLSLTQLMASERGTSPTPSAVPPVMNEAFYSCYRHIFNPTNCTFMVQREGTGNVWYEDDAGCGLNCNNPDGPCFVPPNCTIKIQYTTGGGNISGNWTASNFLGSVQWSYSTPYPASQCPFIAHSGPTKIMNLNDPASGDMTVNQCTWPLNLQAVLLKSRHSGKCLTLEPNNVPSAQPCSAQKIDIVPVAKTTYVKLRKTGTTLVLYSNADGRFGVFDGQEFPDQYWDVTVADHGYRFRSVASNMCLFSNKDGRFWVGGCGWGDQMWSIYR